MPTFFKYFTSQNRIIEQSPFAEIETAVQRALYEDMVSVRIAAAKRIAELPEVAAVDAPGVAATNERIQFVASIIQVRRRLSLASKLIDAQRQMLNEPPLCESMRLANAGNPQPPDANYAIYILWLLEDIADTWDDLRRGYEWLARTSKYQYGLDPKPFLTAAQYASARRDATIQGNDNVQTDVHLFKVNGNTLYAESESAWMELFERMSNDVKGELEAIIAANSPVPPVVEDEQSADDRGGAVATPTERMFRAWMAKNLTGMKQEDIATTLATSQGTVSRWCQKVQDWLDAGNKLPDLSRPMQRATPIDPSVIEIGARVDGRAKHQRHRRTEDDDE
jgi:hypothetical protein